MYLLDSAPNEEKRQVLVEWVGVLILLNRKTSLKFRAQYTLLARLWFGLRDIEKCKEKMDEYMQKLYEDILQYLPKEILENEEDYRAIAVGCANKSTLAFMEEYYFQQTGERIGKNDAVAMRILEERLC